MGDAAGVVPLQAMHSLLRASYDGLAMFTTGSRMRRALMSSSLPANGVGFCDDDRSAHVAALAQRRNERPAISTFHQALIRNHLVADQRRKRRRFTNSFSRNSSSSKSSGEVLARSHELRDTLHRSGIP